MMKHLAFFALLVFCPFLSYAQALVQTKTLTEQPKLYDTSTMDDAPYGEFHIFMRAYVRIQPNTIMNMGFVGRLNEKEVAKFRYMRDPDLDPRVNPDPNDKNIKPYGESPDEFESCDDGTTETQRANFNQNRDAFMADWEKLPEYVIDYNNDAASKLEIGIDPNKIKCPVVVYWPRYVEPLTIHIFDPSKPDFVQEVRKWVSFYAAKFKDRRGSYKGREELNSVPARYSR